MTESKPMKWSELRERVAAFVDDRATEDIFDLWRDIDAAAEAMEQQERDAALWQAYVAKTVAEFESPNKARWSEGFETP